MTKATILIVDDNRPLARSLAELLRRRSFRTLVAATSERALRVARRFRPDLVIADVDLPDGSGHDLAGRIALDRPDARVILVSAGPRGAATGRLESIVATLEKPFDPLRLVALVHQALGFALSEAAAATLPTMGSAPHEEISRGLTPFFPAARPRLLPMRRLAAVRVVTTALVRRVSES
jgi:DNA-binding response OmpR family regulator